jgi:hypothetical protein
MATVDLDNDAITRFVVRHYAYDPARRERRHQVVAVFDQAREFELLIEELGAGLRRRREDGEDVDPREYYGGVVLEPGHLRRAANGHLVKRALAHGVWPVDVERLDLPTGMAVLGARASQDQLPQDRDG